MSLEQIVHCTSMEDARNQAVRKLEELLGAAHGPYERILIGKNMAGNSPLAGAEVGPEWGKRGRIRLDFDPTKGPHYNVESRDQNWAFTFPMNTHVGQGASWSMLSQEERKAVVEWMQRISKRHKPR